jgi:DNA polymerase I-like protein with 3'-5' exonuclease and polymerase domains
LNKVLCLDVESTTYNNGAWYDPRNSLVAIAYDEVCVRPTGANLSVFQQRLLDASILVGFNIKFDLHWLRRVGLDFSHARCYDLQYLEYLLSGQTCRYPSLNEVSLNRLRETKLDKVKEYWDAGVQTTDIPWQELHDYAIQDVALTRKLYEVMTVPQGMKNLFSLGCQDLLVLLDMESHGMKYNREGSLKLAEEYEREIEEIKERNSMEHNVPDFNWGSPDQISALLFGGSISRTIKVPAGTFKSGAKVGQPKFKNEVIEYRLPRRYRPVGLTPGGKPTTDDDTLVKLGTSGIAGEISRIRKLSKEVSTYLRGIPAKQDEGNYGHEMIYGQFNQCVTSTGRLSSSNPNLQNMSEQALKFIESRYE